MKKVGVALTEMKTIGRRGRSRRTKSGNGTTSVTAVRSAYMGRILREVVERNEHVKSRSTDDAKTHVYKRVMDEAEMLVTRAVLAMKARSAVCITSTIADLESALHGHVGMRDTHTVIVNRIPVKVAKKKTTVVECDELVKE